MQTTQASVWPARLVTLLLAALTTGSATYWSLKWVNQAMPARDSLRAASTERSSTQRLAQLLGAQTSPGPQKIEVLAQATYRLLGVIQVGRQGRGSALISQQGKPAKPVRVGEAVGEGLILQAVHQRRAEIGVDLKSPPSITLELPLLAGQS